MERKTPPTKEDLYKRNQKKAKLFKTLAPICFWVFLALSVVCLIFAIKNSFGNIVEICTMLDDKKYTGIELTENYNFLIEKYGQWIIGNGGSQFQITFINIGRALFSGLMIVNCVLFVVFLASAYIVGKWLLPRLAEQITQDNQDMVNLTILKNE